SRQDGFGLVLCQALASGLPVVCTDRTGGLDLAQLPGLSRLIRVVPTEDAQALRRALMETIDDARQETGKITEAERQMLGWRRYASQHLQLINELLGQARPISDVRPSKVDSVGKAPWT